MKQKPRALLVALAVFAPSPGLPQETSESGAELDAAIVGFEQGDYGRVIESLSKLPAEGLDKGFLGYMYGRSLQEVGRTDEAVRYFEILSEKHPSNAAGKLLLFDAYVQKGERDKAEAIKTALEGQKLAGDYQEALRALSEAMAEESPPETRLRLKIRSPNQMPAPGPPPPNPTGPVPTTPPLPPPTGSKPDMPAPGGPPPDPTGPIPPKPPKPDDGTGTGTGTGTGDQQGSARSAGDDSPDAR